MNINAIYVSIFAALRESCLDLDNKYLTIFALSKYTPESVDLHAQ